MPIRSRRRRLAARLGAVLMTAVAASPAAGAPVAFPLGTTVVKLDGAPLGKALHPSSLNSLRFTVAYDPGGGLYHLWVLDGGDSTNPSDMQVSDITHATSADGMSFASAGKLAPPANWWTQIPGVGATAEPSVNYLRVDKIGSAWFLTIWSPNEPAVNTGRYNYNAAVWAIGTDVNNLAIVQHGPLPTAADAPPGPGGNMVGSFGMVSGNIYLRQDTGYDAGPPVTGGGLGRYVYTDGVRPSLSPLFGTSEADMWSGTPYCWPIGSPSSCTLSPSLTPSYVHNAGRALAQGGSTIGAYYTFRDFNTGAREDRQIWYVESADDGLHWAAPVGVYANGTAVLVDGLPNTANFSSPEVTAVGAGYRVYFSTGDGCGNLTVVTDRSPAPALGPEITKSFASAAVPPGGATTLAVTVSAPPAACTPAPLTPVFTAAGFTDDLPAGIVLGNPALVSNTCGGTVSAVAGATSFALTGANLAPAQSCTVTVNVTAVSIGTKANVIPRSGGAAGVPGFFNAQDAAAVADAGATLIVAAAIPALSIPARVALVALLGLLGVWVQRRRAARAAA